MNTFVFATGVWFGLMLFIWIMAEQRHKQIIGTVVVTLWVWGVTLSGLYDAKNLMPDPLRLPSPTIRATYTIEPPNLQKTQKIKP